MRCAEVQPGSCDLPHLLYSPENVRERSRWPLIVFLHGSGERGGDLLGVRKYGLPRELDAGRVLPAFVLAPQCPLGDEWEDVLDRLTATVERVGRGHPVASDRILLTGFSMGGFGSWAWALRDPSRVAAFAPVAGSRPPRHPFTPPEPPLWIFHGAADVHVRVADADRCAAELEARGTMFRYTRYPDADHGQTCRAAYADPELYTWLLTHAPGAPAPVCGGGNAPVD